MELTSQNLKVKTNCYHCGDECNGAPIQIEDKDFCCNGCKTVFEILSENDLCSYYSFEETPGVTRKGESNALFDFLDNEEIAKGLLEFSDGKQERVSFLIPNIHCSSCIWLLEHLSRIAPAVINSKTNFSQRQLTVSYKSEDFSLRQLVELLDRIGYTPVINLESNGETNSKPQSFDRKLLVKMGIAGFCFGNVMLLSFPDYLGIPSLEDSYIQLFRWLNVLLSIPVVFYAGQEYFVSAYKSLKQRFANIDVPIALGVSVLFLRSIYEVVLNIGPGYFDSLVGLIFFLLIGKWFQNRTYQALSFDRDYKSYFPLAILVKKELSFVSTAVKQIKKGDEVLIRNGELVPADAILIDDQVSIDYSFVTGESEAVQKGKGQYIYAGGRLIGKQARFIVQKTVSQSYLTELWNDEAFSKEDERTSLVDRVSQYFTVAIILIALAAGAYWQFTDPSKTWLVFCSVLIIACPCALALSTPFTPGSILRVLGRNKFYVKNADVVEKLQTIDTVIFDKTGTITNVTEKNLVFKGESLTLEERQLISLAVSSSTHPLSRFVKTFLAVDEKNNYALESFQEFVGKGVLAVVSGVEIKLGASAFVGVDDEINSESASMVYLKIGGNYRGHFAFNNVYRKGLSDVVESLASDFQLGIISGDNDAEEKNLSSLFPSATQMLFDQKPADKLEAIKALQENGRNVMMLGDGLNDAGALKQSDVGVAVSEDISTFSPACDAILHADSFSKLSRLVTLAKRGRYVILASFVLSLLYNGVGLSFAVVGWLTPLVAAILMPLSSISVVIFTTLMVRFISLKLKL